MAPPKYATDFIIDIVIINAVSCRCHWSMHSCSKVYSDCYCYCDLLITHKLVNWSRIQGRVARFSETGEKDETFEMYAIDDEDDDAEEEEDGEKQQRQSTTATTTPPVTTATTTESQTTPAGTGDAQPPSGGQQQEGLYSL